jgi:hypothetical protein
MVGRQVFGPGFRTGNQTEFDSGIIPYSGLLYVRRLPWQLNEQISEV